jgi:hypothetical protein
MTLANKGSVAIVLLRSLRSQAIFRLKDRPFRQMISHNSDGRRRYDCQRHRSNCTL